MSLELNEQYDYVSRLERSFEERWGEDDGWNYTSQYYQREASELDEAREQLALLEEEEFNKKLKLQSTT